MHTHDPRQQPDYILRKTRLQSIGFSQMADPEAMILPGITSVLLSILPACLSALRCRGVLSLPAGFLLIIILLVKSFR